MTDPGPGTSSGSRFDLRGVDLNLLVSLHHLLLAGQVTAAADGMGVSQPSMSASLARLRRLLDDPIMVRAGRRMVLTPFAEGLRGPVANIIRDIETALGTRPSFEPGGAPVHLIIAATDYITVVLLRGVLRDLGRDAHVQIEVQAVAATNLDDLRNNRIDLVVGPREVVGEVADLVGVTLFRDRFVGLADAANPEVDDLSLERFSSLPYIAYRTGGRRSAIDVQLDALDVARTVALTTESLAVVPHLVAQSESVSLVHERLARTVVTRFGLRTFVPPLPLRPVTQTVYWHPRRTDDPAHRWLREQVIATGRALHGRRPEPTRQPRAADLERRRTPPSADQ